MVQGAIFYPYIPVKGVAIVFAILNILVFIAHSYQAYTSRTRYMLPIIIGTLWIFWGYVSRCLAIDATDPDGDQWTVINSQVALIVAPALVAAQNYMVVGRMMSYAGPETTWISHNIVTKIFVGIDVICILSQAGGAGLLSGSKLETLKLARLILIGSLTFQVAAFGVFTILAVLFDLRSRQIVGKENMQALRPLFIAFYISAGMIIGRSIFRTIEFAELDIEAAHPGGYLWDHEWPMYVLDSAPVLLATIVFNVWHPSKYLPAKKGLRMDGTYEVERKHWWSTEKSANESTSAFPLAEHQA